MRDTMKTVLLLVALCVFHVATTEGDTSLPQYAQNLQHVTWPPTSNQYNTLSRNYLWTLRQSDALQTAGLNHNYPWQRGLSSRTAAENQLTNTNLRSQQNPYYNPYPNGILYSPYNQYYSSPYFHPLFFPADYVRYHYPPLYQQFPNGFYVLPIPDKIELTPEVTTTTQDETSAASSERNPYDIERYIEQSIPQGGQSDTIQTLNHTQISEKKTFVSRIELEPVLTKFTRYKGRDGKTYVKIATSDSDGQETVTESEYTGNINLKIVNGVLEKPKDSSGASSVDKGDIDDPNSITIPPTEEETEKPETGEPDDITSWFQWLS